MAQSARVKAVVDALKAVEEISAAFAQVLTRLIDDTRFFRRAGIVMGLWITCESIHWCYAYALKNTAPEQLVGVAAVIAAIMTPVATLQGALFKFYVGSSTYLPPAQKESQNESDSPS